MNDEQVKEIVSETQHTLFTNISFASVHGSNLRLDCSSLLLEVGTLGIFDKHNQLRGFGPDPAWPVFTFYLPNGEVTYTIDSAEDKSKLIIGAGKEAQTKPLFSGSILTIKNGPALFLQVENPEHPLDIFKSTGDIDKVWFELETRVAKYWRAPYMPHSSYGPPGSFK